MVYLLVIVVLIALSLKFDLSVGSNLKAKRKWYIFMFFWITGIAALRYQIGGDTPGYASDYLDFPKISDIGYAFSYYHYQPLWMVFESLCRTLSKNFLLIQSIVAVFINLVFFRFINKHTSYIFLAVLFYFCISFWNFDTEIMRESVAIAFCLLSYEQLQLQKKFRSILLWVVAVLFHISAVIFIIIYFINIIKISKTTIIISSILILAIPFIWSNSLSLKLDLFYSLLGEDNINYYYTDGMRKDFNLNGIIYRFLQTVAFAYFILFLNRRDNEFTKYGIFILVYGILGFMSIYSIAFGRFSNYFIPFCWIMLADGLMSIKARLKVHSFGKFALWVVSTLLILYIFQYHQLGEDSYYVGQKKYERYIPYKSVIDPNNSYLLIK